MITLPAMRLTQFGAVFYQAAIPVNDVRKLVRFEVLALGERRRAKPRAKKSRAGVNWEELERKISAGESAYQRPILEKKIDELVQYYRDRYEHLDLAPVPGAVILVADRRLDFEPVSARSTMGFLQLPEEEGLFRTLDGQHRLLALDAYVRTDGERADVSESIKSMAVPAIVFDSLSASHAVEMFVTINTKHTKLKKDVIISLSGRRLYRDERMAVAHDIIRSLNDRQDSPLCGEIRILGIGSGKVSQAPLATELETLFKNMDAAGGSAARRFMEHGRDFFLTYFKQVAQCFETAWKGRKYSLRSGTALRAFIRVVPDVLDACREQRADGYSAVDLRRVLTPWSERIGDRRFETEGEWRLKSAGGGSRTVELLARELRDGLR